MDEVGGDQTEAGSKLTLPRAHKRCINKICKEVLSLATKYCKKCNTVQFERKASKNRSKSDDEEGKRGAKRKSLERSGSEDEAMQVSDSEKEAAAGPGAAAAAGGNIGSDAGLTNIPQATSYAIQQDNETVDHEPFDCGSGPDRPMLELQAGTRVYYQASIIRESKTEIRVLFPETKKMSERREWVDKRSSRIWRGRMESRYWRYIKGTECGWEPKPLGDSTAGGSFKRKGSVRSRGSAGAARSRGTKHSTEDGTESEQRKHAAAALDTAASPRPKGLRKQQQSERRRDAGEASSGAESGGDVSGAERQASGAAAASNERQQADAGDPLEAWFKQHYALLKASNRLGAGFLPASAETGRPWVNGAARRHSKSHSQGRGKTAAAAAAKAAAKRGREERRAERQVARQQASEVESSEDEGTAVASPRSRGGRGGAAKGGRELKRLQMWAWERRSLASSEEEEEEEEEEEASAEDTPSKGSGQRSSHSGDAQQLAQGLQQQQQQQQQRPNADQRLPAAKQATTQRAAAVAEAPAPLAAAAGKAGEVRAVPGGSDSKQPRQKLPAAPVQQQQQQQQPVAQQPPPKPRPAPKPLAPLEECDVFGKLAPIRRQQPALQPTSPRAFSAAAAPAAGAKLAPAAGGSQQLQKPPENATVKAPAACSPADKHAAAAGPAQGAASQQLASNGSRAAQAALVAPAAPVVGAAPPAAQAPKAVLSPLKRKMLAQSAVADVRGGTQPSTSDKEQQQQVAAGQHASKQTGSVQPG